MNYDRMAVLFILFTLLFPPLYITLGGSNIYNGWRHSLFIFSSFAVVAAIGFYETYYSLKNARLRKGFVLAAVIGAMPTACWMVNNSKYCYSYYNALIAQPYLNYDMDKTILKNYYSSHSIEIQTKTSETIYSAKVEIHIKYNS